MRNEILDRILVILMFKNVPIFNSLYKQNIDSSRWQLKDIIDLMPEYETENWMINEYKNELLHKNFIVEDDKGNISITELGKEFKRKGGYAAIDKREFQEDIIRTKTIEKFRYDKIAFWLSILAIGISLLTLLIN